MSGEYERLVETSVTPSPPRDGGEAQQETQSPPHGTQSPPQQKTGSSVNMDLNTEEVRLDTGLGYSYTRERGRGEMVREREREGGREGGRERCIEKMDMEHVLAIGYINIPSNETEGCVE